MVRLLVKRGEQSVLLLDVSGAATSAAAAVSLVCRLNNARLRLARLADTAADIVAHGPMKHPDQHGYSVEELEMYTSAGGASSSSSSGGASGSGSKGSDDDDADDSSAKRVVNAGVEYRLRRDPTGRRTGE
ncbi:hypothetical protein HK405_012356, partial [Cladochytrium tenue]